MEKYLHIQVKKLHEFHHLEKVKQIYSQMVVNNGDLITMVETKNHQLNKQKDRDGM